MSQNSFHQLEYPASGVSRRKAERRGRRGAGLSHRSSRYYRSLFARRIADAAVTNDGDNYTPNEPLLNIEQHAEIPASGYKYGNGLKLADSACGKMPQNYPEAVITPAVSITTNKEWKPYENNPNPGTAEILGEGLVAAIAAAAHINYMLKEFTLGVPDLKGEVLCNDLNGSQYITDTDLPSALAYNIFVGQQTVFRVDESNSGSFNNYEGAVVDHIMNSMVTGAGPQNYVFPENGIISSKFLKSDILQHALKEYMANPNVPLDKQYNFNAPELAKDIARNRTFFSITGLTGSANIIITPDDKGIKIKIFNVTSLTSGTFGKEFVPEAEWPKSFVRNPGKTTPFGNVSQTYNLFISNAV